MTVEPSGVSPREQRLHAVLAAYYEAGESSAQPERQELLDRYPELAADLIEFFAVQDQVHGLAEPFRALESNDGIATKGIRHGAARSAALPTLDETSGPSSVAEDRLVGDYELLGEIARGGMGVVYRARQRNLNRLVALKVIRDGARAMPDDARRFRNEAEAVANLDHPNIVPIYEVGDHRGCSF